MELQSKAFLTMLAQLFHIRSNVRAIIRSSVRIDPKLVWWRLDLDSRHGLQGAGESSPLLFSWLSGEGLRSWRKTTQLSYR